MATRRVNEEQEVTALMMDEDTFSSESLNPALESLYAEMGITDGGDATVHVTKLDADGAGVEANVWKGDPDDYDLEQIAKKFGSGQYRVKVYVRIPTGQKVRKGNKVIAWMLSPEDEARRAAPQQTLQGNPQQINAADIARAVGDAIKSALPEQRIQVEPLAQMRAMAEIMAMMAPPQAAPSNPLGMMRDMAELMTMLRGEGGDSAPIERGANASGNDLLLAVINKFGPLFAQAMPGMLQQAQTAPMPQEAPVQIAAPMPAPATPPPEEDVNLKLKMGIAFLLQQCDAGGAPETYAELVLDSIPADGVQAILNNPAPLDWLAQFEPRVKQEPYAAWLGEVLKSCKELLEPPADEVKEAV